jgi:GAF domain-containing protein
VRPPRLLTPVATLATVLSLCGCAGDGTAGLVPSGGGSTPPLERASALPATLPASDVLRAWDAARADAFADGDVAALRSLYVEGSGAGTADIALLRAYLRRGLWVEEMRMQLLAVEVLREERRLLRLRVTDRLAGAVAAGEETSVDLPRDAASTRILELRRTAGGRWQVASVRESARQRGGR